MKRRIITGMIVVFLTVTAVPALCVNASEEAGSLVLEDSQYEEQKQGSFDAAGETGCESGAALDSDVSSGGEAIQNDVLQDQSNQKQQEGNGGTADKSGDASETDTGGGEGGKSDEEETVYTPGFNHTEAGVIYCDEEGNKVTGVQKIGSDTYYFDENGIMQTGWRSEGKNRYYYDSQGRMVTGSRKIGSYTYYFKKTGEMYKGFRTSEKNRYYYDSNGRMVTGEKKINGRRYFFKSSGAAYTGWRTKNKSKYYYDNKGRMSVGSKKVGNYWYYFNKSTGKMRTGWRKANNGRRYYYKENGRRVSGSKKIKGNWYYFNPSNGSMRTGWRTTSKGTKYYYDSKGHRVSGRKKINGKWYYFASNGKMSTSKAVRYALTALEKNGWNLRAAFNYSVGLAYSYTSAPPAGKAHTEWYAEHGFRNRRGNCYVMAATFCQMARVLGYKAYLVEGYVPKRGGGVTPHGWCEIIINGTAYVCDPDFTHETGRNGYKIRYGMGGTWVYSSYRRVN